MQGSVRWLYLPGKPQIEDDDNGHGTCVASKIASPTFGVAKSANIVVVKVDLVNDKIPPSSATAWGVVARDITLKGLQGKAVVNSATSCEQSKS
jgi:subtilisin family serine protease